MSEKNVFDIKLDISGDVSILGTKKVPDWVVAVESTFGEWYLEWRNPDLWISSIRHWDTLSEVQQAFDSKDVVWIDYKGIQRTPSLWED